MECRITTLVLLLITSICFSQEICNNSIDDDNDGLIDINDNDCLCNLTGGNGSIASYLPNPSFEDFALCPSGPSQLTYSEIWEQCTNTTADYINSCGYLPTGITDSGLYPFPNGEAIAGAIFSEEWREYLGAALSQPMEAGKSYQITFNIASIPVSGDCETCNEGMINYSNVDITLYGAANAAALPVNTIGAPTENAAWVVLGSVQYLPVSSWGQVTIQFTPSADVNAVMLGAPETLSADYANNTCYPYFLFDNLTLNESSLFGGNITAQGDFCSGTLTLNINSEQITNNSTYQWYKEGIAITGANDHSLIVANALPQDTFAVKVTNGENCFVTPAYSVVPSIADPVITITQPDCNSTTGLIKVETPAALYSFDNGSTWSTNSLSPALNVGSYHVKIKSQANCESNAVQATVTPSAISTPVVQDLAYCQFNSAAQLTASGENLLWYTSLTGGNGSAIAPYPTTTETGITTYYVSQTINGCESARVPLVVTVAPAPAAPAVTEAVYYCQYSVAEPLRASGENLVWYTTATGGHGESVTPVPDTRIAGISTFYVSQVQNGCESNRKQINVIVFEAPAVPQTVPHIVYTHHETASPLSAEGENVIWYDADGDYLGSAPRPDTSVLGSTKYYVSQTTDGCESPKAEVIVEIMPKEIVLDFPKFFTPNGDGQNEIWNITKDNDIVDAEVHIYDRNGQLIKQVRANEQGWDGTFNGRSLPATDYWFRVTYKIYGVQKEYMSHFSLVR